MPCFVRYYIDILSTIDNEINLSYSSDILVIFVDLVIARYLSCKTKSSKALVTRNFNYAASIVRSPIKLFSIIA